MSQFAPTPNAVFNDIPLLLINFNANNPLFPVLESLTTSSLLPIIENVVVPVFDGIGLTDMVERADGWFCPPDKHKSKSIVPTLSSVRISLLILENAKGEYQAISFTLHSIKF